MGSRYFVTGVQLGLLKSELPQTEKDKITDKIEDEQYLGEKDLIIPPWMKLIEGASN